MGARAAWMSMALLATTVAAAKPKQGDPETAAILRAYPQLVADLLDDDRLAARCHSVPNPEQAAACRDLVPQKSMVFADFLAIKKGHPYWGYWYTALEPQIAECSQAAVAGSGEEAAACINSTLNAADYLVIHALSVHNPPDMVWQACVAQHLSDFVVGAQCMIAAGDMTVCAFYPNGKFADYQGCVQILVSGHWISDPKALSADFNYRRPR